MSIYMFFGMTNSLEYSILHLNHQKPCFWPFFGHFVAKRAKKWAKISKMAIFVFPAYSVMGIDLYILLDDKLI